MRLQNQYEMNELNRIVGGEYVEVGIVLALATLSLKMTFCIKRIITVVGRLWLSGKASI